MADWFEGNSFIDPYKTDPYEGGTSVSDYPKAFAARSAGAIGDLGAIVRSLAESRDDPDSKAGQAAEALGQLTQNLFGGLEDYTIDNLTPTAKRNLQSTFSDPNFWSLSSMALKTSNMAPDVVAAIVPSLIFPGVGTAVGVAALQGGVLSAGAVVDDMYRMTDELSDRELQQQSKFYEQLRRDGIDEKTARAQFNKVNRGLKPLYVGVVGAITNTLGPAGQAARAVAGGGASALAGAEAGVARRVFTAGAEGAFSETIQEGVEDYATQSAAVEGGLQDEVDWGQVAESGATGGVLGGLLGAGIGGVAGGHGKRAEEQPAAGATSTPSVAPTAPPPASVGTPAAATPPATAIPEEAAPAAAQTAAAAEQAGVPTTPDVTVVPPSGGDPAQTLAIKQATGQPDVAAVTPEVTAEAAPPAAPEVTTEVTPPTQEAVPTEPAAPVADAPAAPPMAPPMAPEAPAATPVAQQAPVTPEAPVAPPVAETAPIQTAPVQTAPVQTVPVQTAPVQEAPAAKPERTGPRVLEDMSEEGRVKAAEATIAQEERLAKNIADAARTEETKQKLLKNATVGEDRESGVSKVSKEARAAAIESKRKAAEVVEKFQPDTDAENGAFGSNVTKAVSARKAVLARAQSMVDAAKKEGVKIQQSLKDNKDADFHPTAADVLLTEATGLIRAAEKAKAAGKELSINRIKEFITREYSLRHGDVGDILMTRRAEGDAAKRQGEVTDNTAETDAEDKPLYEVDGEEGEIVDTVADEEAAPETPEDAVIKREEAAAEVEGRERPVAAKVAAMGVGEGYTVPKAEQKAPKIEAIKKRKLNKDAAKPIEESAGSRTKRDEILKRIAEKRKAAEAEKKPADTKPAEPKKEVTTDGNRRETRREKYESIAKSIREGLKSWPDGNEHLEAKAKLADRLAALSDEEWAKVEPYFHRDMEPGVTSEPEKGAAVLDQVLGKPTVKERIAQAREETNTSPTQAQVEAGNYKKGRVSVNGLPVAIENPKGSIRSNKDPNGPKWSVKMPADYGYIEGTVGADGDALDVYLGPNPDAPYIYVIDQIDPETGQFDEHKVMVGFDSPTEALRTYDKAFSDGLGTARAGQMHKMTLAEFKAWADTPAAERTATAMEMHDDAMTSFMLDRDFENELYKELVHTGELREGYVMDPISQRIAKPVAVYNAGDLLNKLDLSDLKGWRRSIAGNARSKLMSLVGDMDIHLLSPEDMGRLTRYPAEYAPFGSHVFKGSMERVFVRADLLDNPEKLRHTVMHELTHAATVRAIVKDRQLQTDINMMMDQVWSALAARGITVDPSRNRLHYGLLNVKEFIAEAFTNPAFQEMLSTIEASPEIVARMDLDRSGVRSMWDALISSIRRLLQMPKNSHSMLEAAIRVTERSMAPLEGEMNAFNAMLESTSFLKGQVKEAYDSLQTRRELAPTKGNPWLIGLRTFDNIARAADRYFQGNNPVRRIANQIEKRRVLAQMEFDKALPVINKLRNLSQKYRGQVWNDFVSLAYDETMSGVYADRALSDQKHITKGIKDSWSRAQHPDLARRWAALPDDLKAARTEAMEYFRDKQNEAALKLIRNRIVTMFDTPDPEGLAQRIHERTVTDADKALMGEAYDTIAAAGVLAKIKGPYLPLMRFGNFVVKGRNKVTPPGNFTRKLADNEYEFRDKDAAAKWAAEQDGRPTVRTVYVDKTTGETHGTENGKTVKLTADDMNAEARYRVAVQDRYMEMYDTMREARDRVAELRRSGVDADDAVPRAFEGYGIQNDALSVQMRRMFATMERRADARNMTPEQKHELMTALNEMSLSVLGSTRIQSRTLQRTYVAGASKDFVRTTTSYAHSMGNYIAKLDTRPEMDAALNDLDKAVKGGAQDGLQAGRTAIQNEVMRRVTSANPASENKQWNAFTSRIMSMSFLDKLMSPSYSFINALQPIMTTMPYLAGHYGAGRAFAAMSKAYADIGSLKAIQEGFAETLAKMKPGDTLAADPIASIKSRLNKAERQLLDILIERGVIDANSGLEVGQIVRDSKGIVGKLDGGIGYLEGIARQMPKTVEAINRSVSAIAAYRLEMERSGDVARATQFAQDTVNLTQFNYSSSNAAPYMNHPVFRLTLQFKKYGVGMYQLMGEQVAKAWHNEQPGDRAKALKALSYTIGMHVLLAGAMGMPTEPLKLIVTTASGLGVTDWTWGDIENAQREAMANMFGKDFGEIVSRGLPRAVGFDLSSRVGLDSLMGPFGEPRSNEAQDWKAYMWDLVGGAPAGLVMDWGKGVNSLAQGDVVRAAERLIPVKALSDSIKAYRTFTEGTVSEKTGKQSMSPYSFGEAATRALGFTPAREAESFARQSAYHRGEEIGDTQRKDFQRAWVESNGAARGRLWREINKWNRTQPRDARLTLGELRVYQKRMRSDMQNTKEGLKPNRRTQHLFDRANDTYNY